jgi:hypothetical protein
VSSATRIIAKPDSAAREVKLMNHSLIQALVKYTKFHVVIAEDALYYMENLITQSFSVGAPFARLRSCVIVKLRSPRVCEGEDMSTDQVAELLYQALETEKGGISPETALCVKQT